MPDSTEAVNASLSYSKCEDKGEFLEWSVGDLLRNAAHADPHRIALIAVDAAQEKRWTYSELLAIAERAAGALLRDFRPGDCVATCAANRTELIFLQLGAALAGIVLATLNPANRAAELTYQLEQSKARGLFVDRSFRGNDNTELVEGLRHVLPGLQRIAYADELPTYIDAGSIAALPRVAPNGPAMILFTSGTTGKSKAVVLRHSGIVNNALLMNQRMDIESSSVWLTMVPLFHIGGSVTMILGCLANGGTNVLLPEFNPDSALDAIARYRVSFMFLVPTMLYALFENPQFEATDRASMRLIMTGATVITPELVREIRRKFNVDVVVAFGQTEAGGCMYSTRRHDGEEQVTRSVGGPIALSEGKVISVTTGETLPLGQIGEICIRTPCAMIEYLGMPDKTAETLDEEGWLHTGDLGLMRDDGYVAITGRLKDMIIRGGENIYPREIEDVLAEHEAVSQAAVFGIPDKRWGETVAAAVVLRQRGEGMPEALAAFLEQRIARHKVPRSWFFVDSLPTTASGKVQKFVLRDRFGIQKA